MPKRRPYPSDLSDARWELIEPVLAAWRFERRGRALDFGRPPEHGLRDIMDLVRGPDRGSAAIPSARLPALEHGLRLLRQVGRRGRARPAQRPAQAALTREGRA
nr:hypothetical protein [Streptomyces sp. NRRL F-2664]